MERSEVQDGVLHIRNTIGLVKNMLLSKVYGLPYKMNFMVTSACNSRCTTCNIWKDFQSKPAVVKQELTYEEIVEAFKHMPKTITWLSITGGEPSLRGDIVKIIKAAIRYMPNLRLIGMPSNGLAQERSLKIVRAITRMKHPDVIMTFSIDGPPDVHDRIRGIKGAFSKTWDTYLKAKRIASLDKDFQVAIETTISSTNVKSLMPFIRRLLSEDHKIAITVAHDAYLYKNEDDKSISPKKNMKELESLIRVFKGHLSFFNPQTAIERQYIRNIPVFLRRPDKQVVSCEALRSSFALDSTGNILPCLMWGKRLVNLRDVDYDLNRAWKSKMFNDVRHLIKKEKCPNCWTPCEAYQSIFWAMMKLRLFPR